MKKLFFVKKYPLSTDLKGLSSLLSTIEVDYDDIENGLPFGSRIKSETVDTVIIDDTFVVYGEYYSQEEALKESVAHESIALDEVLGEGGMLPSVN
ncbi:MAG: hypothetical protein V4714_01950 [Bacteroidota bacterium]